MSQKAIHDGINTEMISEGEARFRAFFEASGSGMVIADLEGRILEVNPTFCAMLGYTEEELQGKSFKEFTHPDDLALELSNIQPLLDGAISRYQMAKRYFHKEGYLVWGLLTISVISDEHGQPKYFAGQVQDITARKQVEQALQASERRWRDLFENMRDGWVSTDMGGKFQECNLAYEKMLGYTKEELRHLTYRQLTPERWHTYETMILEEKVIPQGYSGLYEKEYIRKDGTILPVEVNVYLIRDQEGQPIGMWGLARDITARKQAEQDLARYASELERSNEDLQQFAHIASHDLQAPLRMVTSYLQLLKQSYADQLDAEAKTFIRFAVDGAKQMRGLIKGLLDYARVDTHGKDLTMTNAETVLQDVLLRLQYDIEECGASITHGPLPSVLADETQLAQLFQNLIENALKFQSPSAPHSPHVHISVEPRNTHKASEWIFAVQDNGIGIEPQNFERIFKVFQRLHTNEEYVGTGIGLAVCKKIVERHGGRIWVESTPGMGTTFKFTLPEQGYSTVSGD
jgi:PAS domain S-box-containing protein